MTKTLDCFSLSCHLLPLLSRHKVQHKPLEFHIDLTDPLSEYSGLHWIKAVRQKRFQKVVGKGFWKASESKENKELCKWDASLLRMESPKEASPDHRAVWKGSTEWEGWEEALSKTGSLACSQETKREMHRGTMKHLWPTYWRNHLFNQVSQTAQRTKTWRASPLQWISKLELWDQHPREVETCWGLFHHEVPLRNLPQGFKIVLGSR